MQVNLKNFKKIEKFQNYFYNLKTFFLCIIKILKYVNKLKNTNIFKDNIKNEIVHTHTHFCIIKNYKLKFLILKNINILKE